MQVLLPCLLVRYCGMNMILIFILSWLSATIKENTKCSLSTSFYELYTGTIIIHLLYTLVLLGKLIPVILCVNVFNCQALYGFPVCTALSSCKSIEDIGLWIKLPVVAFIYFFQFYELPSTCVLVLCFYGEVHGFNFMINCPLV